MGVQPFDAFFDAHDDDVVRALTLLDRAELERIVAGLEVATGPQGRIPGDGRLSRRS